MRVLFICTANACRSQMAEGWARSLFPSGWVVESAGLLTSPVSRRATAVMQEVGIDLSGQRSKSIDSVDLDSFDLIVTLSREAAAYLPALGDPGRHWPRPFDDPMEAQGTPDEVRDAFRAGRELARQSVLEVLAAYDPDAGGDVVSGAPEEPGK